MCHLLRWLQTLFNFFLGQLKFSVNRVFFFFVLCTHTRIVLFKLSFVFFNCFIYWGSKLSIIFFCSLYLLVCTSQFVVMFTGCDGPDRSRSSCNAFISQSTRGLRSLLREHVRKYSQIAHCDVCFVLIALLVIYFKSILPLIELFVGKSWWNWLSIET